MFVSARAIESEALMERFAAQSFARLVIPTNQKHDQLAALVKKTSPWRKTEHVRAQELLKLAYALYLLATLVHTTIQKVLSVRVAP